MKGDRLCSLYDSRNSELVKVDDCLCFITLSMNIDKISFTLFSKRGKDLDGEVIIRGVLLCRGLLSS